MTQYEELPERIQNHLRSITESSGLPPGDESLRLITENWLAKRRMFEQQTEALDMQRPEHFAGDDPRGVLLLTYSGSLISLGANNENGRWFEYASIKLRNDVPDLIQETGVSLAGDVEGGETAAFSDCPIGRSSEILLIATCPEDLAAADQERRLREATIFLTNGFVKLNRTLTLPEGEVDHFTTKSMVSYVAKKNGVTQAATRQIIDDFLSTVEAGVVLGERVPLGKLGKLHSSLRAPQQARVGRNPQTGEELVIGAKPATYVPRLSASSYLKERLAALPVPEDEQSAP